MNVIYGDSEQVENFKISYWLNFFEKVLIFTNVLSNSGEFILKMVMGIVFIFYVQFVLMYLFIKLKVKQKYYDFIVRLSLPKIFV